MASTTHHVAAAPAAVALPVAPLTWLFLVAGALGLLSVVVPHDPEVSEPAAIAVSALGLVTAAVLRALGGRVGPRALAVALVWGAVLIGAAILATAGVPNATAAFYTWVALYAFYALSWRAAAAVMVFIAASYAVVIAADPPPFPPVAHWTTTVGTLAGSGVLVGMLKHRLDRVIGHLADAAQRDPLTGVLNRRGLREAADRELARTARTGRPTAVLLLDVDRFKAVNDRFGHGGGDAVLTDVAAALEAERRAGDVVARTGGEEFAIVLPETDGPTAVLVAERLRSVLSRRLSRPGLVLTASLGLAVAPDDGAEHDELLAAADRALYAAKRSGRDRVVRFDRATTAELIDGGAQPARQESLVLLAESLDLRDASTAAHSQTVGRLAATIAARLGLDPADVELLRLAGVLHDVGKLSMPDSILLKPGKLTAGEWALVRRHPELGARLLEGAGLDDLATWVRCHHERLDGRGYPSGLSGDAIPLPARILAVADAYEAMVADRPYRAGRSHDEAVAELRRHAGTQFDPAVVEAFVATAVAGTSA